jgi:ribonuclease R
MNLVVGNYVGHPDGYGFVQPLPRPGQINLPDIYVSGRDVHGSMHGDKVVVRVAGHLTSQRLRGEIIRVLDRAHQTIVGNYEKGRTFGFVVPVDDRLVHHIYVNLADTLGAQPGQVVMTEITEYPSAARNPEGKIIEIIGRRGEKGLDTELLIRKHSLPAEFPPKVIAAAEKIPREIPEAERCRRTDLTGLAMATIDPVDAKDFDDAVSLEISEKGNYLLGVHIADVSYYVRPGEVLDDEAYERATTIYLEDRVLPMLPERISNDLCSLREKVDRLAMSVMMELDPKGNLLRYEILDSVIRVNHRMTYDNVLAVLDGDKELTEKYADFVERFRMMNRLAQTLRAKRIARGSLDFNFPEARAIFDSAGEVAGIALQKHSISHELIEEFMLLANETVARHVTARNAPMMYRIHEEPDPEKMGSFREFIGSLGYALSPKDSMTPRGLQKISSAARGRPEEALINYLMLRSLKEARYSSENAGHFGLASDCYTHFTSPIRRYPDLVVHRIARMLNDGGPELVEKIYGEGLERMAEHASRCEREAMEAERESLKTKQLMFMSGKLGEVYEGRITGVQSYGMFVELIDSLAEGMVRVSTLEDDYYAYIEEKHCLQGENTGTCYRLGDKVHVQVVTVDVEKRRMNFVLVDTEGQPLGMSPRQKKTQGPKQGVVAAAKRHGKRSSGKKRGGSRRR